MTGGRRLAARYVLGGDLVADSPLHIGAASAGTVVDLEVVRDGLDRIVIPGTSLAGVLRAVAPREDSGDNWWGTHLDGSPEKDETAHASRITVTDAPATGHTRMDVRDGVSIDRITGAAAHRHLFTRQVVPTGTRFTFSAWLDVPHAEDEHAAAALMQRMAARLAAGVTVGAAGSAGLGRVHLNEPWLRREGFGTPDELFEAVLHGGADIELTEGAPAAGRVRVSIPWRPLGAVVAKAAAAVGEVTTWPRVDTDADNARPALVIPGTSIKGILRSHAERIVRTLTGADVTDSDPIEQLEQSAALPGIGELFGAAADLADGRSGRRGLLSVGETTAALDIPVTTWRAVRAASAQAATRTGRDQRRRAFTDAVRTLNEAAAPSGVWFDIAARTAIDRWTGSASDGLLFTALEPHAYPDAVAWSPIELDLDLTRDPAHRAEVAEALLALILMLARDLAEGWIPIGFATTRGLGAIRADPAAITITVDTAPDQQVSEAITALHNRTLHDILATPALAEPLDRAWGVLTTSGATAR